MIHTYSLIHDDLPAMDDDDLRRGKPTSHKVFGEAIAILAGDALLTRAFHLLAEVPADVGRQRACAGGSRAAPCSARPAARPASSAARCMDLESEGKAIDAASLERLHRAKTGALLSACVRGGAILGGAGEEELPRLTRYAAAHRARLPGRGRRARRDRGRRPARQDRGQGRRRGKATYVSVHGLERARASSRRRCARRRSPR